jgi:nucleoside-diphosphate-sugar epimerase
MHNETDSENLYNVVDAEKMTKKNYVDLLLKKLYPGAHYIYIPYKLLYLIVLTQEMIFKMLKRKAFLTRYRLASSQRNIVYDTSRIQKDLRWNPPVSIKEAIDGILEYEQSKPR